MQRDHGCLMMMVMHIWAGDQANYGGWGDIPLFSFSGSVAGVDVLGYGLGLAASIICKATTNCCWIGHTEGNGERAKVQS